MKKANGDTPITEYNANFDPDPTVHAHTRANNVLHESYFALKELSETKIMKIAIGIKLMQIFDGE